jgi:hypothetical protein
MELHSWPAPWRPLFSVTPGRVITLDWLERHHGPLVGESYVKVLMDGESIRVFVNHVEVDYGDDPPPEG